MHPLSWVDKASARIWDGEANAFSREGDFPFVAILFKGKAIARCPKPFSMVKSMNKHDDAFLSAFMRSLRLGVTAEMPWRELAQWAGQTTELSKKTKTPKVANLVVEFFRAVENIVENGKQQADERLWEQLYAARLSLREAMKATPMENIRILSKATCKNLELV